MKHIIDVLYPDPSPTLQNLCYQDVQKIHRSIEELARQLWWDRGCPENKDLDIWLEAEKIFNSK